MHMKSDKDISVSCTAGVAISFKAGVARPVPDVLRVAAITAGAIPVADGEQPAPEPAMPADARAPLIQNAIKELIARNDESKFKTNGAPRVDAVREITNLDDITAEEIDVAFALVDSAE
jgi:hypothetical protein